MSGSAHPANATPIWFWVLAGLALLWNLMGVGAFFMDMNMTPEQVLETYGAQVAEATANQPGYVTFAYGLAVLMGAMGSLFLLLRKRIAIWPLLLSLLGVLVQQSYTRFGTDMMDAISAGNKTMYLSILIIALLLVWFARAMTRRGILR